MIISRRGCRGLEEMRRCPDDDYVDGSTDFCGLDGAWRGVGAWESVYLTCDMLNTGRDDDGHDIDMASSMAFERLSVSQQ